MGSDPGPKIFIDLICRTTGFTAVECTLQQRTKTNIGMSRDKKSLEFAFKETAY